MFCHTAFRWSLFTKRNLCVTEQILPNLARKYWPRDKSASKSFKRSLLSGGLLENAVAELAVGLAFQLTLQDPLDSLLRPPSTKARHFSAWIATSIVISALDFNGFVRRRM